MSKQLSEKISHHLRELREKNGWSLDIAAQQTGVSKAMLGQIERGESSPTIATLWKIVTGFNESFSSFFANPLVAAKISKKMRSKFIDADKMQVSIVFPYSADTGIEVFEIALISGHEQLSTAHYPGVIEHVLVTKGVVEIFFDGVWHLLRKGQTVRFDANQAHGYANHSKKTAEFQNIICYPR